MSLGLPSFDSIHARTAHTLRPMRLILVRHGDAHAGFHGPISGPLGCRGLTDVGRAQAESLRSRLGRVGRPLVDVLVTSKLPRAIETAEIIAPALGFDAVPQDCDLCEVHTGDADGVDWAEYADRFGPLDMHAEPDTPFAPGGDSWNSFHARVEATMHRFADEYVGQTVMAVTSAGVIAASLRLRFGGPSLAAPRMIPTNTGLTEWESNDETAEWTLRSFDDVRHLVATTP